VEEKEETAATESKQFVRSLKEFFAKIFEILTLTSKTGVILHVAILFF